MDNTENLHEEEIMALIKQYFPNQSYDVGDNNIRVIINGNKIETVKANEGQHLDVISSLDTIEKVISIIANVITISAAMKGIEIAIQVDKVLKDKKENLKEIPLKSKNLRAFITAVIENRTKSNL